MGGGRGSGLVVVAGGCLSALGGGMFPCVIGLKWHRRSHAASQSPIVLSGRHFHLSDDTRAQLFILASVRCYPPLSSLFPPPHRCARCGVRGVSISSDPGCAAFQLPALPPRK